jgi:transposase
MTPADTLAAAAATYRTAQDDLDNARLNLAQAVRDAVAGGMSQSEAARIVGVDRLTIRKWIAS